MDKSVVKIKIDLPPNNKMKIKFVRISLRPKLRVEICKTSSVSA
jgi:hypothetical protein